MKTILNSLSTLLVRGLTGACLLAVFAALVGEQRAEAINPLANPCLAAEASPCPEKATGACDAGVAGTDCYDGAAAPCLCQTFIPAPGSGRKMHCDCSP